MLSVHSFDFIAKLCKATSQGTKPIPHMFGDYPKIRFVLSTKGGKESQKLVFHLVMQFGREVTHGLKIFCVALMVNPEQILNGKYSAVLLQGEETLPHGLCNPAPCIW